MASSLVSWLITICMAFIPSIYAQNDVCLWGRFNSTYTEMNGLFRVVNDLVNGKYYYKMDNTGLGCSIDTYHMFYWDQFSIDATVNLPTPTVGWYISTAGFSPLNGIYIISSYIYYIQNFHTHLMYMYIYQVV